MKKILSEEQAAKLSQELKGQGKKIVLAGGCFDILHIGHIRFLEKAKEKGDFLFALLESDESVKKLKGKGRPVNKQKERAKILSSLSCVDCVIKLNGLKTNEDYDKLVSKLNPDVLAATYKDKGKIHKVRQAKKIGAKLIYVLKRVPNQSSTKFAKMVS